MSKTIFTTLALALSLAAAGSADAGDPVISGAEARSRLDVTVYNHDLALVREVRRVDLPRGNLTLEFRDDLHTSNLGAAGDGPPRKNGLNHLTRRDRLP